jgi:IclR family transcriptional regulator, pca regulon regulatory protein
VPVYAASGRVVATVNLSGNAPRLSVLEMQSRFLAPLRTAANELSAYLN